MSKIDKEYIAHMIVSNEIYKRYIDTEHIHEVNLENYIKDPFVEDEEIIQRIIDIDQDFHDNVFTKAYKTSHQELPTKQKRGHYANRILGLKQGMDSYLSDLIMEYVKVDWKKLEEDLNSLEIDNRPSWLRGEII